MHRHGRRVGDERSILIEVGDVEEIGHILKRHADVLRRRLGAAAERVPTKDLPSWKEYDESRSPQAVSTRNSKRRGA